MLEAHAEDADHPVLGGQGEGGRAAAPAAGERREPAHLIAQPADPDGDAGPGRLRRRKVGVEGDDEGLEPRLRVGTGRVGAGRVGSGRVGAVGIGEPQPAAVLVEQPQAAMADRAAGDRLVPEHPHHLVDGEGPGQEAGERLEAAQALTSLEAVDGQGAQLGDRHQERLLVGIERAGLGEAQAEDAQRPSPDVQGQGDQALVQHRDGGRGGERLQPRPARREEHRLAPAGGLAQGKAGVERDPAPPVGHVAVADGPPHLEPALVVLQGQHPCVGPDRGNQLFDDHARDRLLRRRRGQRRHDELELPQLVEQHDGDAGYPLVPPPRVSSG